MLLIRLSDRHPTWVNIKRNFLHAGILYMRSISYILKIYMYKHNIVQDL